MSKIANPPKRPAPELPSPVAKPIVPVGKEVVHSATCPAGCPACTGTIDKALRYLVSSQQSDGRWKRKEVSTPPPGTNLKPGAEYICSIDRIDVALTAVGGLALLSEGSTTTTGKYAASLKKAVEFLKKSVRDDGNVSTTKENSDVYQIYANFQTPFAALFLAETYAGGGHSELKAPLERIARFIASEQDESTGGWGYGYRWAKRPTADKYAAPLVVVTACNVTALAHLRRAGIAVSDAVIKRGVDYLRKCRGSDGSSLYSGTLRMETPGASSASLYAMIRSETADEGERKSGMAYMRLLLPAIGSFGRWEHFSRLFAVAAMNDLGLGAEGHRASRDTLLRDQQEDGSWIDGDRMGGVIFATAVNAIVLQMEFRRLPILHDRRKEKAAEGVLSPTEYLKPSSAESRVKVGKSPRGSAAPYVADLILSIEERMDSAELRRLEVCIAGANRLLGQLTRGQMGIGRVDIHQDRKEWEKADIRLQSASMAALHGQTVVGQEVVNGKVSRRIGEYVRLPRRLGSVNWDDAYAIRVFTHELCHYLFGLPDEYHETSGEVLCRGCLMAGAGTGATELCASENHADRRHDDCWSAMRSLYPDLKPPSENDRPVPLPDPRITIHK